MMFSAQLARRTFAQRDLWTFEDFLPEGIQREARRIYSLETSSALGALPTLLIESTAQGTFNLSGEDRTFIALELLGFFEYAALFLCPENGDMKLCDIDKTNARTAAAVVLEMTDGEKQVVRSWAEYVLTSDAFLAHLVVNRQMLTDRILRCLDAK